MYGPTSTCNVQLPAAQGRDERAGIAAQRGGGGGGGDCEQGGDHEGFLPGLVWRERSRCLLLELHARRFPPLGSLPPTGGTAFLPRHFSSRCRLPSSALLALLFA